MARVYPRRGHGAGAHGRGEGPARTRRRARRRSSARTPRRRCSPRSTTTRSSRSSTRTCRRTTAATSSWSTSTGITLRERIAPRPDRRRPRPLRSPSTSPRRCTWRTSAGIVHRDIKPSNVLLWKSPLPGPRVAREDRRLRHRLPARLQPRSRRPGSWSAPSPTSPRSRHAARSPRRPPTSTRSVSCSSRR